MGKRLAHTPYSKIKSVLRGRVWMWSRERSAALKRANGCCEECGEAVGRKGLEVHHLDGTNMKYLIGEIMKYLLPSPERLQALCKKCHEEKGDGE